MPIKGSLKQKGRPVELVVEKDLIRSTEILFTWFISFYVFRMLCAIVSRSHILLSHEQSSVLPKQLLTNIVSLTTTNLFIT